MPIYDLFRAPLFAIDPERAHNLTLSALQLLPAHRPPVFDPVLQTRVAGIDFASPVGLAAGFDKDALAPRAMIGLGFGFVEIGTLTPRAQAGNPKPRLFRLVEDRAVINRMGFNNNGIDGAFARLTALRRAHVIAAPIGVNIGANKDSVDRIADYACGVRTMAPVADYLTINISSPNTPGLRKLQDAGALAELLAAISEARGADRPPLFLKLAPDLSNTDIDDIARVTVGMVDAIIIANTTISRPALVSRDKGEAGGLSGAPLAPLALMALKSFRAATGGSIPLIAAGGIESAHDAYTRIRSGASLIQLYSALVYHGPGLARKMATGLTTLLKRDGFSQLADAVGCDA